MSIFEEKVFFFLEIALPKLRSSHWKQNKTHKRRKDATSFFFVHHFQSKTRKKSRLNDLRITFCINHFLLLLLWSLLLLSSSFVELCGAKESAFQLIALQIIIIVPSAVWLAQLKQIWATTTPNKWHIHTCESVMATTCAWCWWWWHWVNLKRIKAERKKNDDGRKKSGRVFFFLPSDPVLGVYACLKISVENPNWSRFFLENLPFTEEQCTIRCTQNLSLFIAAFWGNDNWQFYWTLSSSGLRDSCLPHIRCMTNCKWTRKKVAIFFRWFIFTKTNRKKRFERFMAVGGKMFIISFN